MSSSSNIVPVSATKLRHLLNAWLASRPPGVREVILKNRHPAKPAANEPFCTKSLAVSYLSGGVETGRAHRYLRPDGTIGASGKTNPKLFFDGKVMYVLQREP